MPIGDARKFLTMAMNDATLRKELNKAVDQEARTAILEARKMAFTDNEFQDGFRSMLVQCQTEDAADQLREIKMWWEFLQRT